MAFPNPGRQQPLRHHLTMPTLLSNSTSSIGKQRAVLSMLDAVLKNVRTMAVFGHFGMPMHEAKDHHSLLLS